MLENIIPLSNAAQGFFIRSNKFKTTHISYNFYLPLNKDKVAGFALLPFILTTCGREYPDFSKLNYKLDKLYSASLTASAEKVGDYQLLKVGICVLDDKYALDGEPLVLSATELLNSLVFDPLVENGAFSAADVEREKRKAIEHVRSELAEKRFYAKKRLMEEMFKDDVYGTPKCGTEEQIAAITPEGLYAAWREMISRSFLRVNVISANQPQGIFENLRSRLASVDRSGAVTLDKSKPLKPIYASRRVEESMDVAQGKLVMGFSVEVSTEERESAPFTVMCDIFGGGPYSRLFTNVREKLSLCYYCAAGGDKRKGYITVDSGVEAENAKKAETEILRQLDIIKCGRFGDFEFESSKKSIINALKGYGDHQDALDSWYTLKTTSDIPVSPEEYADYVSAVQMEAVVEVAKTVKLNTVYTLMPKGAE